VKTAGEMAAGTPERWQALGCHHDFGEGLKS